MTAPMPPHTDRVDPPLAGPTAPIASPIVSLDALVAAVLATGRPLRVAVAPCAEAFVLQAAAQAHARGLADPICIGNAARTLEKARQLGIDPATLTIVPEPDDAAAVQRAVDFFRAGEADLIMKGLVSTSTLLKAILNKDTGVPPQDGILSHVTVFDAPLPLAASDASPGSPPDAPSDAPPPAPRLMLLTDAGVNIRPTLQRKAEIVKNAVDVARRLGIAAPRVAMLAATEKVNYPAMPATLDADMIAKMADQGAFGDVRVAGPMALDMAVSPQAAALKGATGPDAVGAVAEVAGHADILCAPDIESANILYKALGTLLRTPLASVVVGSRVPVVVPSRADSGRSKFLSIALAAWLARTPSAP
ncbi:MAG: phosphate acyltransferase [Desulfovibrionaceae bacterium]